MDQNFSDAQIMDTMIEGLVKRLVDGGVVTADYLTQLLISLSDPDRRPVIDAAVSCSQRELNKICAHLTVCATTNHLDCECFHAEIGNTSWSCPIPSGDH